MRVRVGTSGFSFKGWKGVFYPSDLAQKRWLSFYASRLPAVEINSTFYRMPRRESLLQWAAEVPEDFAFVIKASRRITHIRRLSGAHEDVAYLVDAVSQLGGRLGALLFQLPPDMRCDLPLLRDFVARLPATLRACFEFRHPSWLDDAVCSCLQERDLALCVADKGDPQAVARIATASWGYLRLRAEAYSEDALRDWVGWVSRQAWNETFVFFKHDEAGIAPALAARFLQLWADASP